MPSFACLDCGARSDQKRCELHRPRHSHRSKHRDRGAQARFRKAVLERDGFTCVTPGCGHFDPTGRSLRAAHRIPLRDFAPGDPAAYDPANGDTKCADCDRATDRYAT